MKIKRFSGYSEASPSGVTYHNSQVISKYIIDPIDKSMDNLEKTPIGETSMYKRKKDRIKRILGPLKKYFKKEE